MQIKILSFEGFYGSVHSDNIDNSVEIMNGIDSIFERYYYDLDIERQNEIDNEFECQDTYCLLTEYYVKTYHSNEVEEYSKIDYKATYKAYANHWIYGLNNILDQQIKLKFDSVFHPREYNFGTDQIYCTITQKDVRYLYKVAQDNLMEFKEVLDNYFTPYSGFIPYYSNIVEDWLKRDFRNFDANEVGILLETYILVEGLSKEIENIEVLTNEILIYN